MKTLSEIFFSKEPFKSPGRFIFWVGVDLFFVALSVYSFDYYETRSNVAETIFNLLFGALWAAWLYTDLDRWFLPKKFPEPVPAQRSATLEDEE